MQYKTAVVMLSMSWGIEGLMLTLAMISCSGSGSIQHFVSWWWPMVVLVRRKVLGAFTSISIRFSLENL
jgi:hypothetical protein